jgi:hypothetical protein
MAAPKHQRSFVLPAVLATLLVLSAAANIWLALHHVNVTQFVILPPGAPVKQEPEAFEPERDWGTPGQFCGMIDNPICNQRT